MRTGSRLDRLGFVVVLVFAAAGAPADAVAAIAEGAQAGGSFASRGVSFDVSDAYAFRSEASFGDERVIAVAISNAGFNDEFVSRYRDRRHLLDNYFRDDQTGLVYFEFSPAGEYQAFSYYLGSGNGCGYCSGGVESTVKLDGGRLRGTLRHADAEDEREFAVELDVAIADDDFGLAQGEGGGEPGRAYLAYHRAVTDSDAAALRTVAGAGTLEALDAAEKDGRSAEYLAFLRDQNAPTVRVTEALVKGDRALVLVAGERSYGKVVGEAILSRVDGAWRVDDEMLQLGTE
jgi:hypothetical protein